MARRSHRSRSTLVRLQLHRLDRATADAEFSRLRWSARLDTEGETYAEALENEVEAPTLSVVAPLSHLAAGERRLKKGFWERERTVILMLDEVILNETPPLYSCYGS